MCGEEDVEGYFGGCAEGDAMSFERCSSYYRALLEMGLVKEEVAGKYPQGGCDAST